MIVRGSWSWKAQPASAPAARMASRIAPSAPVPTIAPAAYASASLRASLASPPARDGGEIAGIRERLVHLYGDRARLEAHDQGTERHALIALPA